MKTLHWLGVLAVTLSSASLLAGCSGSDTPSPGTGGTGTGGTGATGGTGTTGGSGGPPPGMQLTPPASYVELKGADAMAGMPAPAAWSAAMTTCSTCHGTNGEGVDSLAPEVRHTPAQYATWIVRNGRTGTGMVSFDMTKISDADLMGVITWLDGLPHPTTPAGLYKDFCGNCHGPTTPTGGNVPVNISMETIANVQKFVRMGNGTDPSMRSTYMPAFSTTDLSDAELTMIEQFIGAK